MTETTTVPGTGSNGAATAGTIDVENPSTGTVIASVPVVAPDQVAELVARARAAQPGWEALGFDGREQPIVHFPSDNGQWKSLDISGSWKALQRDGKTLDSYELRLGKKDGLDFKAAKAGIAVNVETNVATAALQRACLA